MAVNNSLTKKDAKPKFSAVISSEGYRKLINNTLRDPKRANRFVAAVTSAVSNNPTLQECEPSSIISAALLGESLELSPSSALGQYWFVPYNDNKTGTKKAQFQLGVNGYKQLAIRSGQYLDIDAIEVREGEYKGRDKHTGKPLFEFVEDDETRENLPIVGYLSYIELLNGFKKTMYFSHEKMLRHADRYSKAFNLEAYKRIQAGEVSQKEMWKYSSPWYTDFTAMALKTMIRQILSKWGVLSIELVTAIDSDMSTVNDDGTYNYVDNAAPENATDINVPSNTHEESGDSTIIDAEYTVQEDDGNTHAAEGMSDEALDVVDDFFN